MTAQFTSGAVDVFTALVAARPALKEEAIRTIDSNPAAFDRDVLRSRLLAVVRTDYRPPRPGVDEDRVHADTRCWLLSALGRVADADQAANEQLRKHLDPPYEPYEWARFWTLEGLINGRATDLLTLAEAITRRDDEAPLVLNLARVVIAHSGSDDALDLVRTTLKDGPPEQRWSVLRGIRVVPSLVPSLVGELCPIVDNGDYNDVTFDAIVALGKLSPESQYADKAAMSLQKYLIDHRWPMYESMRIKALIGLGNLRVERAAAVLMEETLDESPSIVHEAARALEKVLGVRTTTGRLMETAARLGPDSLPKFATALRSMRRNDVVEALEAVMLSAPDDQRDLARQLLSEVGGQYAFQKLRARTTAAEKYTGALEDAEEKIRTLFETSILEAQHGFRVATRMDVVVFAVGVGLIGISAFLVLRQGNTLDQWAGVGITGGTGVLGVLYSLFVAKPRTQVQASVDHLMHLKVVFLGYLRQLHQIDQAYTRRLLDDEGLTTEEVKEFSDLAAVTMTAAVRQLSESNGSAREPAAKGAVDAAAAAAASRLQAETVAQG
jgi:HEAT repeat protein